MGCRSDVAILFTLPDNIPTEQVLKELQACLNGMTLYDGKPETLDWIFNEIKVDEEEHLIQLFAGDIKWYTGCSGYEDINNIMAYIHSFTDKYEDGGYHFVRIGESIEDVEEEFDGDDIKWLGINRSIDLAI